ncbi:Short-chain dehydrogenase [Fontibacillus panacisegetis]|uniref:Short-chain dehydrogenase n=1 Tax=Fontibacillus panacisegetis TaxID=670482 RepID=A0A1G7IV52_9BACL|nr:oxidoreductase [Fontibacillus panacisegetis]SDF16466.1 Short-chain dehydrogenase [Fontibacillus panacisegetis]
MSQKVVLITGASSGIGKEAAIELKNRGFTVYAAARRIDKMQDLATKGIRPISMDVTNDESMIQAVNEILKKEGRIDVLINNAGYGSYGAIEDVPQEEARRQMEVNVFGLARMIQLVVPSMRKNQFGKIVNVTSMGGKVWTRFGGWYHATKFAVEGLSDCLRLELEPFGIDVIVVEPGGIKTEWGFIAAENLKQVSAKGPYAEVASKVADNMIKNYTGNQLSKPALIARTIAKAVTVKRPKTRYLVGYMAKPMVFMKNIFGDRTHDRIIKMFS